MPTRLATLCLAILSLLVVSSAHAQSDSANAEPQRLSLDEYRMHIENIKEDVEAIVAEQFAQEERELELLAQPYEIGSRVKILYRRGPNYVEASGVFRRLNINAMPAVAIIGDFKIPYNDIHHIDQQRLLWGSRTDKKMLLENLAQKRQELERRKKNVSTVEFNKQLNRLGYTADWRQRVVPVNGFLWEKKHLGDQSFEISALVSEANPFAQVRILNRSGNDFLYTAYLGNQPVATNLPREFGASIPDVELKQANFWIRKEDLMNSSNLVNTLANDFSLSILKRDVGQWTLTPDRASARSNSQTVDHKTCPECFGVGSIIAEPEAAEQVEEVIEPVDPVEGADATEEGDEDAGVDVVDLGADAAEEPTAAVSTGALPAVSSRRIRCPRCEGRGAVSSDLHRMTRVTMSMNLEMGRGRIVDYTPSVADEWIEATNAVYAYQAGIQKRIAEIKAAARKDRVENAGRLQAEEEARRREAERQAEYEQRRERVEKNYEWLSPSQARTQLQSDLTNVRSSHYGFDDSNFPSVIRQQDARRMLVESMTKWYRVNVKVKSEQDKYEIMNANYRFMKAKVEDSTTVQFYLQYALKVDFDAMSGQLQLAPTVTVVEEETNKEYTGTNTYRLDAPWFGSMIGLIEITPELLINGVGDVKITAEVK